MTGWNSAYGSSVLMTTFVPSSTGLFRSSKATSSFPGNQFCHGPSARPATTFKYMTAKRMRTNMSVGEPPEGTDDKPLLMSDLEEGLEAVPGFTDYSELLNGRAAMVGFIAALGIELVTGRGLISIMSELLGGGSSGGV